MVLIQGARASRASRDDDRPARASRYDTARTSRTSRDCDTARPSCASRNYDTARVSRTGSRDYDAEADAERDERVPARPGEDEVERAVRRLLRCLPAASTREHTALLKV